MKSYLLFLAALLLAGAALAEEIDGELNLSLVGSPYEKAVAGFCGSYRPDLLQVGAFSLGGGLSLSISNRFLYSDNDPLPMPDSTAQHYANGDSTLWLYERDYFVEFVDFDFFLEGRWQFLGTDEKRSTKAWLTLNAGAIVNSAARFVKLTNFEDSVIVSENPDAHILIDFRQAEYNLETLYRTDLYVSPGLLIGLGNFYFGYRHWFSLDQSEILGGEPARMVGTVRLGYRFTW